MKNNDQLNPYYPISLNIGGKRCTVIGGGQVAYRKVKTLLEHGANVKVVSPDLCTNLAQLAKSGKFNVIRRDYQAGDLQKAFIAIAATSDRDTNSQVSKDARRSAILVNAVDDADNSDFILPSYISRGDFIIAISTSGKSPALAHKIRLKLEKDFGDEYASLNLLINEIRTEIKRQGTKVTSKKWEEALDLDSLLALVKKGNTEEAKTILLDKLATRQKGLPK